MDVTALADARAELRPGKTDNAIYDLRTTYPKSFDYRLLQRVTNDVSAMLGEETPSRERQSVREQLRRSERQRKQPKRKPKDKDQER